jgi:hypothetical protein
MSRVWIGPGLMPPHDHWEHFRGEDLLVYAYCARDRQWARWDGPGAIWRWLPGPPETLVYKLGEREDRDVMRSQTRDLDIRMGRRQLPPDESRGL